MRTRSTTLIAGAAAAVVALGLAGCATSDPTGSGGDAGESITIGSFAFSESEILAEIYAQALEAEGFTVERSLNLGPRQTTIPALEDGSIDLIPEYNGNLLSFYDDANAARTTEEVDTAAASVIPEEFQLLASSPAEDKDAYVVTRAKAEEFGLSSIADLAKIEPFTLGANPQFTEFSYGLPGLADVYGIADVAFQPIEDFGGADTVKALVDDAVQVADIYTTSPDLVAKDLVVLDDPEHIIAAQNVVPLINRSAYSAKLEQVLDAVSAKLTTDDLIALRERVEGSEKAQADVAAKDWLTEAGLI
ncbi:osmoprotectant transport system substrate-binding protein [Homoserinimonas aerilata]|uniref:Osmoprotectant transport system substrate-binding protein n=2 Tax=Homoserinimonas aerilata TaxID=1162970 RepID=A0A542YGV4_9MICO|nr:osmoprotectant transport system substrate-binding protein [Homoserinimonas aerilata]